MIIQELADKYWAARFILTYFKAAFDKIESAAVASSDLTTPVFQPTVRGTLPVGYGIQTPNGPSRIPPVTPPADFALFMDGSSPSTMFYDFNAIFETSDLCPDWA